MKIAVIGSGAFGATTATRLAELGETVSLFERLPALMQGTSFTAANRLHLGFHYPRDDETARQCKRGFSRFSEEFAAAVLPSLFNAYFIAREGSLTSPSEFLAFCHRIGLPYRPIQLDAFQPAVQNVALGVMTEEIMFDGAILRRLMTERLRRLGVETHVGCEVIDIRRDGLAFEVVTKNGGGASFDAVVNCCYAESNRLTAGLGHRIEPRQYEYVAMPIIELDLPELVSITILDGPFMSLLPLGRAGQYLLFHVQHSVIAHANTPLPDQTWLDPATSPFAAVDKQECFELHRDSSCKFIPALRECRLKGFVQGPRMVLAHRDDTDARPSIVTKHEDGYISVFSGKVDHCLWVAEEVASKLGCSRA